MRIGVISDTHGLFDESLPSLFDGVDAIIHAGDIGKLEVIERLKQIAPVLAVNGNNDHFRAFPEERLEDLGGCRIMIRHIFGELHQLKDRDKKMVEQVRPEILVFGHSHRPYRFSERRCCSIRVAQGLGAFRCRAPSGCCLLRTPQPARGSSVSIESPIEAQLPLLVSQDLRWSNPETLSQI